MDHFVKVQGKINILDKESRKKKTKKIIAILSDYSNIEFGKLSCLDIGCSTGLISINLGHYFKKVIGIDVDRKALKIAESSSNMKNVAFEVSDGTKLDYKNDSFDVIICNHIYEHILDYQLLFDEINRVLKPSGICYLAGPNKYRLIEPHYKLPFLSWIPKRFANSYLKLTRRGKIYEENLLSHQKIKKELQKKFSTKDYTLKVLANPKKFYLTENRIVEQILTKTPKIVFKLLRSFIPTNLFVLRPKKI